jgi:membrane protease YdiL (CAAX protease family)
MRETQIVASLLIATLVVLALLGRLRFLSEEFPDRIRAAIGTALLIAVLALCVFYPAATADQASRVDLDAVGLSGLFVGHAVITVFLIGWWLLRKPEPLLRFLHLDRWLARDVRYGIWLGAMGWVATILVTAAVAAAVTRIRVPDEVPHVPEVMVWIATLPIWKKLVIILVAMTVEEGFFRAFLQSRIGWIPSSLLFAIGHASYGLPLMMVSVLVISLVMGWSFRRNGRLLPCIVAHGTFDAIQLFLILPFAVHQLERELLLETLALLVPSPWFPVPGF